MHKYFKPSFVNKLILLAFKPLMVASIVLLVVGLYLSLIGSPPDYQQGDYVRIMYVHVPSATISMAIYVLMASFGAGFLIWRNPIAYLAAKSLAPIGATLAFATLATGSIWGRVTWGAWWIWQDPRLISMLILFFLYMGFIMLSKSIEDRNKQAVSCSVLALLGVVNIPIIRYSVYWWRSQHQPASITSMDKIADPAIHSSMLLPLFTMFLAFVCISAVIFMLRLKTEIMKLKSHRDILNKT